MVSTFIEVEQKVLKPLFNDNEGLIGADDLLPMAIFVTIKARCVLYRINTTVHTFHKSKFLTFCILNTYRILQIV